MYNNYSDVGSESVVDIFKEEIRDVDELVFENDLRDLICLQFGFCEDVYARLVECGLDVESLLLIKEDDLKEIFPTKMLGTRIKFRSRIFPWQQRLGVQRMAQSIRTSRMVSTSPRVTRTVTSPPPPSRTISTRVSSPPATPKNNSTDINSLYNLLQSSPKGRIILKFFEDNSKILDDHRVSLVNIIVDHFKDRQLAMNMSDIVRYTAEIGALFPTEEMRYYYSTRGKGLNPMGKLYDKAINARRKIKKTGPDGVVVNNNNKSTNNDFESFVASKEELEKKAWLSQNIEPWEDVVNVWKQTFRIRRADILKGENILENWPLFQNSMGYNLIDIDFVELFPDSPADILDEWPIFRESIVPYLRERIKDPDSKELLERLNDEMSQDSKDCTILFLLHAVIKPPLLSTKLLSPEGGNKRRKWKPSISDARNATILHCISMDDFYIKFENLQSEAAQKNKVIQPQLMVIGENLTKLKGFYVMYDCILYKVQSFVKSLDILLKFYYVMNLEFRLEAKYIYELIESYFFKIKISSNPNIIGLTNYLNDCKSK
ncbi:uncharacterized protein LOC129943138 [Eupeodes corollae]|uniref:uncharacterized protein LOC129943138 n=1 Tax=Eupeodes corollae TaxID=290404 RepID=UPI002493C59E|nr:uncharacterized protein LOC129943138 [Eupeodes corollae]